MQPVLSPSDPGVPSDALQELVHGVHAVLWEMELPSGAMLFVSDGVERILGYPRRRLLEEPGFLLERVVHPDDRDLAPFGSPPGPDDPDTREAEYRALRADGAVVWLRDVVTVVRDAEGAAVRLRGVMLDITGQVRAREALREREAQLAEAQAIARLGSWEWEVATDRIHWSEQQFRLHGEEPVPEVDFAWFFAHVHPDDRAWMGPAVERTLVTGEPFEFPYRVVLPTGEVRWLHTRGKMELAPDGRPLRMVGTSLDITAMREAEAAVRASEESYRSIFDSSNDAIFLHDLETGRVLDVNRMACEVYGVTREQLLEEGVRIIGSGAPPYTEERAREYLARAAAGEPQRFEWCTPHQRTGEEMWVEVGLQRVTIRGQERLLALVRDIRERKRSERALLASEESYRTIFEYASDAMWLHDVDSGAFLATNRAACEIFGYSEEEMLAIGVEGISWGEPPYDLEHARQHVLRAVAGEPQRFEWICRHRDGSPIWTEVRLRRVTIGGEPRLLATGRDIGDRKAAEDALRRTNEELERRVAERTAELADEVRDHQAARAALVLRSEELERQRHYFELLITRVNHGIAVWDAEGRFECMSPNTMRNPAMRDRLMGLNHEEYGQVMGLRPEVVELRQRHLARCIETREPVEFEETITTADGGQIHLLRRYSPIVGASGELERVVGYSVDITQRKRAEEAMQQAKEEAERANRAKSEFLSRMSHELRTPMNSILGFAQVLERTELTSQSGRSVQHILRAGRHLLQLINEVLDIARIEAGRHDLSLEPVNVGAVVQEAIALVRPLASQHRVEVEPPILDGDPYVHADRQRLVQVLLNLLSNAIKYNRPGGRVRLGCSADDARVRLRVEDTGPGIPPASVDQLFTPFGRLGAERTEVEGTGLGLALSRRLAEAMGGSLDLEATGPAGTVFRLELDGAASPLPAAGDAAAADDDGQPAPHSPALLLYVEDNLANLSLVETILLSRPRWRTMPALQGRLGVELAREHRPDLVLLDLHLPDLPGEEVLRQLRAGERTARTPVVVISADATRSTIDRLLAAGASAFLTKPLDVQEFLDTLDRLLPARGEGR
jgi:PAS domain S-box-containing protein